MVDNDLERLLVVSSDTHVGPRMQDVRQYCPKKYLGEFDEFAASRFAQADFMRSAFETTFSDEYRHGNALNQGTTGHWDPVAWLRDMDKDGVAGGLIFHNSLNGQPFPFDHVNSFGSGATDLGRERLGIGRQMYNRWLSDFTSVAPDRMIGLAQLPFWDVGAAIAELQWSADHGLKGVNFPAPGAIGNVQPDDTEMDRFFAAAADLEMTLATHIGAQPPTKRPVSSLSGEASHSFTLLDTTEWGIRVVYALVFFGIFERHPNLKLVVTEVPGVFWDDMNHKMDTIYDSPVRRKEEQLPKRPSEYTATNVWMGNSFQSRFEAEAAIRIGRSDRFLWGSDYPHPEGTFTYSEDPDRMPMTRLALANTYHDLPLPDVRNIIGENALRAFPRINASALRQVANRVGPTIAEINTAPNLEEHPYVHETGTLAFRSYGAWS